MDFTSQTMAIKKILNVKIFYAFLIKDFFQLKKVFFRIFITIYLFVTSKLIC